MSRNLVHSPRVFCIGWHKTGTSTIGLALTELGYSVLGCRLDMIHPLRADGLEYVMRLAGQYDALQDVPWAALFRELDQEFPGSRFILTEREEQAWMRSALRHFGGTHIPLHDHLYGAGVMKGNESIYLERYRRHNKEVKEYFSSRQSDLLVLDFSKGHGWQELCKFLGAAIPGKRFPHRNKGPHSYTFRDHAKSTLRSWTPDVVRRGVFEVRQRLRDLTGRPDPRNVFNNFVENRRERQKWKNS